MKEVNDDQLFRDARLHRLGHRAFFLFLSGRIKFTIFLFVLTGAAWYAEQWVPFEYGPLASEAVFILFLISIAYLLIVLLRTWLEYRTYTYMFTEEAFVFTKGYVTKSEIAALYHQIQNVNIERGMLDRMSGVSSIVIMLTGGQHDAGHNRIVLPAVGRVKAKLVQKELLVRARRHSGISMMSGNHPPADVAW